MHGRVQNTLVALFSLIDFYLLNTRSTNNKVLSIKDYVVNSDLDILATTEI